MSRQRIDVEKSAALSATFRVGADDEIRTRDIDLGKVALYQLSYIRMPVNRRRDVTSAGSAPGAPDHPRRQPDPWILLA